MALPHQINSLFAYISAQYGESRAEEISAVSDRPVSLRINRIKSGTEEVEKAFADARICFRTAAWSSDAYILTDAAEREIERLPIYEEGKIYLQSLSSMLPPLYLAPKAGECILDMTAAPGGKTSQMYALSEGKALITACERDKIRFERLKFNLQRQGATRVTAILSDALKLSDFLSFDKILLDAPCTGSGTSTQHAPIRFTEEYLAKCVRMQEKLLRKALRLLKKGGTLVYSTCSILKEENWQLLDRVLPAAGGRIVPIQPPEGVPTLPSKEGTITVCPTSLYEGFFVAKIEK